MFENPNTENDIIEHAKAHYPREACGILVKSSAGEIYLPCRNLAVNQQSFILHPEDYAAAEDVGEIMAIVHSHPDASSAPSQADKVACENSGLRWVILGYPVIQWSELKPTGAILPYIGRIFQHGVVDCYTLIKDWYQVELGIELPWPVRPDDWWKKKDGPNLYLENFPKNGFFKHKGPLEIGDLILFQIMADTPNHGAIYLGDGIILHHLYNRLSGRDVFEGYYAKHQYCFLRHEDAKKKGLING